MATKHDDVISGMWKFDQSVPIETLCALAEAWKKSPDGSKYLDLHVRQCSKDQYGIGFQFVLDRADDDLAKRFRYKMTDLLKRRFGNNFVGWDVSRPTYIIC